MNWKISIITLLFLVACKNDKKQNENGLQQRQFEEKKDSYYNPNALIEVEELQNLMGVDSVKIIDFRKPTIYANAHVPNAINISREDIQKTSLPYKGAMADKTKIEKLLSNKGISNNDLLVVYDDKGECDAARFWWVMYVNGFYNVKLLNGGLHAWKMSKGELTTEVSSRTKTNFQFPEQLQMPLLINKLEVKEAISSIKPYVLIDTRTTDEFTGKRKKKGAFRAGHIPKAKLFDWANAIEYNGTKKFKSYKDLSHMYGQLIKSKDESVIVYCHTGVRSAHTTFVLTQLLGYRNVKNYDGSWCEWSYYKELPIEK